MKITLLTGKTFDISQEIGMDIKVVPSRSGGKLVLRIDSKEHIPVLSVPRFCSRKKAINFVNENMGWLLVNLNKLPKQKKFADGEVISLFGEQVVIKHQPQTRGGVWLKDGELNVSGGAEFLHRRVKDYIKQRAAREFYIQSQNLAQRIGCRVNGVSIKDTKSRWGSCSSLQHINYSWRIALAPQFVINYLLAHEVAHLKHADHSHKFWLCVADLEPDWQKGNDWLKHHGKDLYIYP